MLTRLKNLWTRVRGRDEPAHLRTGRWGEKQAAAFLKRTTPMKILGERVRIGKHDEIDLVAREADTLVFIEVKTRASEAYGRPARAVNQHKRRNLSRAALRYVKRLRNPPKIIRFDIVEVIGTPRSAPPQIRHLRKAFTLEGKARLGNK